MAYIGKSPIIGNFVKLDAITAVNGQAAYTMQNGGSNFTDYESVNQFLVSLNGTIQAPTDSFTVSGSTLTFASNLSTGDVIDFIMVFGNSLSAGTPTDATVSTAKIVDDAVTAAKINNDIISGLTALAETPADTDELLLSDGGTLKRIDYSYIKSSPTHTLLSTTNASSSANVDITSNINSTYKAYMIEIINMHIATDDKTLRMQFFQGGSVNTGGYDYAFQTVANNTSSTGHYQATNEGYIEMTYAQDNANDADLSGRIFIYNPADTTFNTNCLFNLVYQVDGDNCRMADGCGRIENTTAVDGVRFYMSSGNIDSGIFKLYGVT